MKKKLTECLLITVLAISLISGCGKEEQTSEPATETAVEVTGQTETEEGTTETDQAGENQEQTPEETDNSEDGDATASDRDYYHDYMEEGGEIALVIGVGEIDDGDYNQAIYEGMELYAQAAGVSYSYYVAKEDTEEAYRAVFEKAIESGCRLLISSSSHYDQLVGEYQDQDTSRAFLMVDGIPRDNENNPITIGQNVHCVTFKEEQAGYLAGYLAVKEGYTCLGFIGGEPVEPVQRYGLGYVQGIQDAAVEMGITSKVRVDYWYSNSFLPNDELEEVSAQWYENGTEIIFCCGGLLYESVLKSAEKYDRPIIGVDIDQSEISDRILTSAMKGVDTAVIYALDDYFAFKKWSEDMAGQVEQYGVKSWCAGLPTAEWRFSNVTVDDYMDLYGRIREDESIVPSDPSVPRKWKIKVVIGR